MADSNRLGDVYIHLLRNAAESAAAFPGGTVTLEFVAAPGGVVILLHNPSAAFDADGLRRCFLPFESSKGSSISASDSPPPPSSPATWGFVSDSGGRTGS